jgi:hypothetical protein
MMYNTYTIVFQKFCPYLAFQSQPTFGNIYFPKVSINRPKAYYRKICVYININVCFDGITVELHLSGLTGTARHSDMQIIGIIGLFFENRTHRQFEVQLLIFTVYSCV